MLNILLFVICYNRSVFFVNKLIVALFLFTSFNSFFDPFLKLEFISISWTVESKLETFFTFPELLKAKSFSKPASWMNMLLIIIIEPFYVWLVWSCVSVFIEKKFWEVVILKWKLKGSRFFMIHWCQTHSKGVNYPFWL